MSARDWWREHVEQWAASGLTAAQYGERAGVNPRTLGYWKWRLGRDARACVASRTALAAFVEVRPTEDRRFELELAGGRRVRVPASFDSAALRQLIEALEGQS
jgi:hypothetical protein